MQDAAFLLAGLAVAVLSFGLVVAVTCWLFRRVVLRWDRDLHRISPDERRQLLIAPSMAVPTGVLVGAASSLFASRTYPTLAFLLIAGAIFFLGWAAREVTRRPRLGVARLGEVRWELVSFGRCDWTGVAMRERESARRRLTLVKGTGARLQRVAAQRGVLAFWRRRIWLTVPLAAVTLYAFGFFIWAVTGPGIARLSWTTPFVLGAWALGPAQLLIWWRLDRFVLDSVGRELEHDSSRELARLVRAPRASVATRLRNALAAILDQRPADGGGVRVGREVGRRP